MRSFTYILFVTLIAASNLTVGIHAAETETQQQRAARLLEEAARQNSVRAQAVSQEVQAAYQTGVKLMNDLEYEDARASFEHALALAPGYAPAQAKLRTVNSLLGIHTDRVGEKIHELENDVRVQRQEALIVIQNLIEEARRYEERGTLLPANADTRADALAEQLANLKRSHDRLTRARELLNYLPPGLPAPAERAAVDEALRRVKAKQ